jgi:hypothetical protein
MAHDPVSVPASGQADTLAGTETGPSAASRCLSKFSGTENLHGAVASKRRQESIAICQWHGRSSQTLRSLPSRTTSTMQRL